MTPVITTTETAPSVPAAPTAAAAARQPAFTDAEREMLRTEDTHAATAIVGILLTIFVLGLIGYICIALWAAGG